MEQEKKVSGKRPQERESKSQGKGSRYQGKGKGSKKPFIPREEREESKSKRADLLNDVSWYTKYADLASNASRLGFNHIGGYPYKQMEGGFAAPADSNDFKVMALRYVTTIGLSETNSSAFMLQIRKLYLAMKRKYRGLNTYEAADLGIVIFCICEWYRYIAKLERIYGICKYFNARNRAMPKILPSALGFNFDQVAANLADFRYGINTLITKGKTLCLPLGIDVVNRWFLLESNIFKDADSDRASYYLFDDDNIFYAFSGTAASSGSSAIAVKFNPQNGVNLNTTTELIGYGQWLLDQLITDDDVTLILGDLVSYFTQPDGAIKMLNLELLPEDYMVVPVKNDDILLQIHNANFVTHNISTVIPSGVTLTLSNVPATSVGAVWDPTGDSAPLAIYQYAGLIRHHNYIGDMYDTVSNHGVITKTSNYINACAHKASIYPLDTWIEAPSSDDVLEMTRLVTGILTGVIIDPQDTTMWNLFGDIQASGTEMLTNMALYSSAHVAPTRTAEVTTNQCPVASSYTQALSSAMSKFDWHPIVWLCSNANTSTINANYVMHQPLGDFDNCRTITVQELEPIHDAVIMSLFDISNVDAFK